MTNPPLSTTKQPGVPLESLPEKVQDLFTDAARVYRERLRLPDDAPLRVILPENPGPEFQALLFADGAIVVSDIGELDLGIVRD